MIHRVRSESQGGFALAMVVLMLFAIAVAGVTGFQVVSNEFNQATQNRDSQEALFIARAGLQRFLGETVGQVGDSVSYAIGNGIATVTTRKVLEKDSLNHLYYIRAEGSVADARTPLLPAVRTVGTYAWHRLNPIPLRAAVLLTGGTNYIYYSDVSGVDHATTGDCPGGSTTGVNGIGTAGSVSVLGGYGGSVVGGPGHSATNTSYSNYTAVYNAVKVRWDILSDPSFPVDFEGAMPDFASLPSDSFPIVRYNGNLTIGGSYQSGRGVLIVRGTLTILYDFVWDGIIMAGRFYYTSGSTSYGTSPIINGMLIGGMNSTNSTSYFIVGDVRYNSCNFYAANRSLSYLQVLDNALFEVNG